MAKHLAAGSRGGGAVRALHSDAMQLHTRRTGLKRIGVETVWRSVMLYDGGALPGCVASIFVVDCRAGIDPRRTVEPVPLSAALLPCVRFSVPDMWNAVSAVLWPNARYDWRREEVPPLLAVREERANLSGSGRSSGVERAGRATTVWHFSSLSSSLSMSSCSGEWRAVVGGRVVSSKYCSGDARLSVDVAGACSILCMCKGMGTASSHGSIGISSARSSTVSCDMKRCDPETSLNDGVGGVWGRNVIESRSAVRLLSSLRFSAISKSWRKYPCPFSPLRNASGGPLSTMAPQSMMITSSHDSRVCSLCAMVICVVRWKWVERTSWIRVSVSWSTELVASSRHKMRRAGRLSSAFFRRARRAIWCATARDKHRSCFCPMLSFSPETPTFVSSPKWPSLTSPSASCTCLSVQTPYGSTLSRTVPEKMKGSCGMANSDLRRRRVGAACMGCPARRISDASSISARRKSAFRKDVFPDPVLPHTPIRCPVLNLAETDRRARRFS
eukprot:Sspe_Gene.29560::Locus_14111_Transcript_1_1_Confidence_1.000_Length_5909::g.29560::m.29560